MKMLLHSLSEEWTARLNLKELPDVASPRVCIRIPSAIMKVGVVCAQKSPWDSDRWVRFAMHLVGFDRDVLSTLLRSLFGRSGSFTLFAPCSSRTPVSKRALCFHKLACVSGSMKRYSVLLCHIFSPQLVTSGHSWELSVSKSFTLPCSVCSGWRVAPALRAGFLACLSAHLVAKERQRQANIHLFLFALRSCSGLLLPPAPVWSVFPSQPLSGTGASCGCCTLFLQKKSLKTKQMAHSCSWDKKRRQKDFWVSARSEAYFVAPTAADLRLFIEVERCL